MDREVLEFDLVAPDLFPQKHYFGTRSDQEERGIGIMDLPLFQKLVNVFFLLIDRMNTFSVKVPKHIRLPFNLLYYIETETSADKNL